MIEVIRQFHHGMRDCVRNDGSVCSEWFEVAQGLHQGYVLSPLLLKFFFVAILLVTVERFLAMTRIYSQTLPIFKSSRRRLALKPRWNERRALFGGYCILTRVGADDGGLRPRLRRISSGHL